MGKDKRHRRKNSSGKSESGSGSDDENLSRRMHDTSLSSTRPEHVLRHNHSPHPSLQEGYEMVNWNSQLDQEVCPNEYASGYRQYNAEPTRYPDAIGNASQPQNYQSSSPGMPQYSGRSEECVPPCQNDASRMPQYDEARSRVQNYASQQQHDIGQPCGTTIMPHFDGRAPEPRNYALGSGMPQYDGGRSQQYGRPSVDYASRAQYPSYGGTAQPRYDEQVSQSQSYATFGSGMPQYDGERPQEYGQPSQVYASRPLYEQQTSYEASAPPAHYDTPLQYMPQTAQYEQMPNPYGESGGSIRNEMQYPDGGQKQIQSPGKAGTIPPSDSSVIGPFVRFTTVDLSEGEHGTWIGSVLIVMPTSGNVPSMEIVADAGDNRPFRLPASNPVPLDAHEDWTFWRFDVRVPLFRDQEQTVSTRIAFGGGNPAEAKFAIAGSTTPLRMAFYSCNGVSSDCTDADIWKCPDSLWKDVLAKHEAKPFHFMIGGGDQIYCDPVWTDVPECKDWIAKSVPDRIKSPFSEQAKANVENFYFDNYRKFFNSGKYSQGLRAIPSIMVIDDHDIFDGVGTYPEILRSCPFMWGVARIGYRFFLLFQQHTTPAHSAEHGFFGGEGSHNFVAQLNEQIAVVGIDGRRERRLDQILHPDTYSMMNEQFNRVAPSTRHMLALLGVPILYPRLTVAENILQCVNGISSRLAAIGLFQKSGAFQSIMGPLGDQPELMDDLGDHWTAPPHEAERLRFIEQMQAFARSRSIRVTFVSGDVHCCGVGRFKGTSEEALDDIKRDPYFMLQIISSAIQNVPPPAMVISALHKCSSRIPVNSSSDEDLVDLFGRDAVGNKSLSGYHKLLNRRNWATIEQDESGNMKFKLRVEEYSGSGVVGGVYGVVAPPLEI